MKKTYFVKKDPNMPNGKDNWIMMNAYDFALFMKTPEGQARRENFGQLDACEMDDSIYVFECGAQKAKKLRAEKDNHDYLSQCEKDSGFMTFSYSCIGTESDDISGEELLVDESCDVESEAISHMERRRLYEVLDSLDESEYELIHLLFLSEEKMSVTECAVRLGKPRTTVQYMAQSVLSKMKIMMEE